MIEPGAAALRGPDAIENASLSVTGVLVAWPGYVAQNRRIFASLRFYPSAHGAQAGFAVYIGAGTPAQCPFARAFLGHGA